MIRFVSAFEYSNTELDIKLFPILNTVWTLLLNTGHEIDRKFFGFV